MKYDVVALITFTLASAPASTTASTSCALLLGLIYLGLVTWMQAIWSIVFAVTIITWDFSIGHAVPMARLYVPLI